ncbi:MAG TPA: MFS transporter [Chitinophagaceae bacterium]|jgi:MFS family permease|nr:MFS transporter [Chitinophagaceae bacterium]
MDKRQYGILSLPVIVGALGFFVDVYDLLLFSIIRKPSLKDLGLTGDAILTTGENILMIQMIGILLGGIIWGVIGDKKGRKSVLFGSILLYSIATIANGMVTNTTQYTILRFIAGLGLAGELGASITLTSEILPKEKRGIAATIIATTGVMGTITAYFVNQWFHDWRLCYYIGGAMGLLLLLLRIGFLESSMFDELKKTNVSRGNFFMFFNNSERFLRYLRGILIGLPVWYVIGILMTFSDKFAKEFGIGEIDPGRAVMYQYVGLAFGDLSAGLISNIIKSRKKTLFLFYGIVSVFICLFFLYHADANSFYLLCAALGFGAGISVLYITMSAEQFGTNLRATAAISIPNFVRGFLPLIILLFKGLRSTTGNFVMGGWITGIIIMVIAVIAAWFTRESFGKDLNFLEL